MKLTPDQLQENWNNLIQIIDDTFADTDERHAKLREMYNYFEDRMMFTPASGIVYYHNAFPGGYVLHVLNIIKFALKLYDMYKDIGMHTLEYNKENVIFCAMHHDLGKVGDLHNDYYVPNNSEWHRINQGKMYTYNDKIHHMTVTDRSIWLLNYFNVHMSEVEYLALRLTDGMYEEANKGYLMGFGEAKNLKTNLPYLLHAADMMATRWEKEQYMFGDDPEIPYKDILNLEVDKVVSTPKKNLKRDFTQIKKENVDYSQQSRDLFNELFGEPK